MPEQQQELSANVSRLREAGLLDPATLTDNDLQLIGQFTAQEIGMMIQIASKAYGSDTELVKLCWGRTGDIRLLLPL